MLFAGCQREELLPAEIRVQLESVTGSRARFTVAPTNPHAYYSYIYIGENEDYYNAPVAELCETEISIMEHTYTYFQSGDFMEIFFYQGSRQFTLTVPYDDMNYKLIVFQVSPQTHEILGEPVVCTFHTKPVPERDLHFDITHDGDLLTITPSDNELTYVWQFEETDMISNQYGTATNYLYEMVGMYQEYGFLDYYYFKGPCDIDLSIDNDLEDGTHYTLVICGCEDGEFTSTSTIVNFIYHPGRIEVLDILEGDEW